uniref:Uncharacterized protein n=1 Tax=Knipowitschia caucasica TaxID=637954 RepID=A0AAV2KBU2_KNICA
MRLSGRTVLLGALLGVLLGVLCATDAVETVVRPDSGSSVTVFTDQSGCGVCEVTGDNATETSCPPSLALTPGQEVRLQLTCSESESTETAFSASIAQTLVCSADSCSPVSVADFLSDLRRVYSWKISAPPRTSVRLDPGGRGLSRGPQPCADGLQLSVSTSLGGEEQAFCRGGPLSALQVKDGAVLKITVDPLTSVGPGLFSAEPLKGRVMEVSVSPDTELVLVPNPSGPQCELCYGDDCSVTGTTITGTTGTDTGKSRVQFSCSEPQDVYSIKIKGKTECTESSCTPEAAALGPDDFKGFKRTVMWELNAPPKTSLTLDFLDSGLEETSGSCPGGVQYFISSSKTDGPPKESSYCPTTTPSTLKLHQRSSVVLEAAKDQDLPQTVFTVAALRGSRLLLVTTDPGTKVTISRDPDGADCEVCVKDSKPPCSHKQVLRDPRNVSVEFSCNTPQEHFTVDIIRDVEPNHMEPNHMEPNHMEPNHMEPNHMEPNHMEPNHMEPNHMEPNHMEPNHMEPNHMEPNHMEPNHMEPNHMEPNHMEPNHMEPNHMEPNHMEPNHMEPNHMEPNHMEPNHMEPNHMEPNHMEPNHMEPNHMEPNHMEPNHMEPNHMEPNHMEPNHMEPNHMEPNHMEPNHIEPNHMEPNHIEPNHMEPNHIEPNHVYCAKTSCSSDILYTKFSKFREFNRTFIWDLKVVPTQAFQLDFPEPGMRQIQNKHSCPDEHTYSVVTYLRTGPATIGTFCKGGAVSSVLVRYKGRMFLEVPANTELDPVDFKFSHGPQTDMVAILKVNLPRGVSNTTFMTPNFPGDFPDQQEMLWDFVVPGMHNYSMTFTDFTLPECISDDVVVEYLKPNKKKSKSDLSDSQPKHQQGNFQLVLKNCATNRTLQGLALDFTVSLMRSGHPVLCSVDLSQRRSLSLQIQKVGSDPFCEISIDSKLQTQINIESGTKAALSFLECPNKDLQLTATQDIECISTSCLLFAPKLDSCLPMALHSATWRINMAQDRTVDLASPTGTFSQSLPGHNCSGDVSLQLRELLGGSQGGSMGDFCFTGPIQKVQAHTNISVTVKTKDFNKYKGHFLNVSFSPEIPGQ